MNDPQPGTPTPVPSRSALRGVLLDEWPYLLVLGLALVGRRVRAPEILAALAAAQGPTQGRTP